MRHDDVSIARKGIGQMIPSFTHSGVLPPFVGQPHEFHGRSPYLVSMTEMAERFGTTEKRQSIFRGLLRYRAELRAIGIHSGFQWIDGSFVEDVETTRQRPPSDVDVVTFATRPAGMEEDANWAALVKDRDDLFASHQSKLQYSCDAYFVDLQPTQPAWLIMQASYWSGLFSHQRDTALWKGMLQVELGKDDGLLDILAWSAS